MYEKDKSVSKVTNIKITFNPENSNFSVYNDGDGISTDIHQKEKIHIPQLILGNF